VAIGKALREWGGAVFLGVAAFIAVSVTYRNPIDVRLQQLVRDSAPAIAPLARILDRRGGLPFFPFASWLVDDP
jgi:hypothetical protein